MFWAGLRFGQGPEPSPSLPDFLWSPVPALRAALFISGWKHFELRDFCLFVLTLFLMYFYCI